MGGEGPDASAERAEGEAAPARAVCGPGPGPYAIEALSVSKTYRVHERAAGLFASLKSVFRRRYREVRAVDAVSFAIRPGERVGFLGPNGAGKTTTLKLLSGLLHPTSGEVRTVGHVPGRREAAFLKRITLVMGQKQQLLWDLPPAETFAQNRALYGVPRAAFDETYGELDRLLGIGGVARKPTRQLSLGERMKCELAAALLHRPEVLFLDEPTIGLDVSMQLAVRGFIRDYNERCGATVLLTSHDMDDVRALCPRVIVIDGGAIRYDGDLERLARAVRDDKRVGVRLPREAAREEIEKVGEVISGSGESYVLRVARADLQAALSHLVSGLGAVDLTVEDPPLEEVMRDLFGRPGGEGGEAPP